MFRWYVVNTYSGHENKVKHNLEHRVVSLNQQRAVRQIVVPTETVSELKDNQKVMVEKRTMPGYVLVNMDLNEDSWALVKGTPGVTGPARAGAPRPGTVRGRLGRAVLAARERREPGRGAPVGRWWSARARVATSRRWRRWPCRDRRRVPAGRPRPGRSGARLPRHRPHHDLGVGGRAGGRSPSSPAR